MTLQQVLIYKPFWEKEGSSVHKLSNPKVGQSKSTRIYNKIRGKSGSNADESSNHIKQSRDAEISLRNLQPGDMGSNLKGP